jgi:hypothetical protein
MGVQVPSSAPDKIDPNSAPLGEEFGSIVLSALPAGKIDAGGILCYNNC